MLCIQGIKLSGVHLRPAVGSSRFYHFEIHPAITLSTNNRITLCSYYVQLSTTLCEQLHTIVENVMYLFFNCPKITLHKDKASLRVTITASITLQI